MYLFIYLKFKHVNLVNRWRKPNTLIVRNDCSLLLNTSLDDNVIHQTYKTNMGKNYNENNCILKNSAAHLQLKTKSAPFVFPFAANGISQGVHKIFLLTTSYTSLSCVDATLLL